MSTRYNWSNSDGLLVRSGRRANDNELAGSTAQLNGLREVSFTIKAGETGESTAFPSISPKLPGGATITDVRLEHDGALTSLVDLVIGVAGSGITDDPDGLVLAIDAAEVLALVGNTVKGSAFDGTYVVNGTPLADDAYLTWGITTASGAGNIKVTVYYTADILVQD